MTTINLELNSWEARFLLEACRVLHDQWLKAANNTTDEDQQADYSNDLGQLEIVQRRLEDAACKSFGPGVKEFFAPSHSLMHPCIPLEAQLYNVLARTP